MAIPESQLETWSHQGSVTQSAQTYDTIHNVLNDSTSPYYAKNFSIFLQGSYGNDTNVYRDSDVDVVIRLNQTYYADTNLLTPDAKTSYDRAFNRATYQYSHFKTDVLAWLQKKFGADVKPGKKAIFIKGEATGVMLTFSFVRSIDATALRARVWMLSMTKVLSSGPLTELRSSTFRSSTRRTAPQSTRTHISGSNAWSASIRICGIG